MVRRRRQLLGVVGGHSCSMKGSKRRDVADVYNCKMVVENEGPTYHVWFDEKVKYERQKTTETK